MSVTQTDNTHRNIKLYIPKYVIVQLTFKQNNLKILMTGVKKKKKTETNLKKKRNNYCN